MDSNCIIDDGKFAFLLQILTEELLEQLMQTQIQTFKLMLVI